MPAVLRRTALVTMLLAGALMLAACGGSDDEGASTVAAAATTSADGHDFCAGFEDLEAALSIDASSGDFVVLGDAFTQAAADLKAVEPPAEVADAWSLLIGFYEEFGTAFSNADLETDKAIAQVGKALTKLQEAAPKMADAGATVGTWAAENC